MQRSMLKAEIKLDEENLDLIYPVSVRIAVEEREKKQADEAMQRIAMMGDKLSKSELQALKRAVKRSQHSFDDEEDEREAKEKHRHHKHHQHASKSLQEDQLVKATSSDTNRKLQELKESVVKS